MLNAVLDMTTGELLEMRQLLVNPKYKELWGKSYTKELGRLAQGVPGVTGTDTIIFNRRDEVPLDRIKDETYGRVCVNYRPEKEDPNRTRLTVGGNRINYPGEWNANSRYGHCKTTPEQCHLHQRRTLLHNRSKRFLPHDTHDTSRVHAHEAQGSPDGICQIIQAH